MGEGQRKQHLPGDTLHIACLAGDYGSLTHPNPAAVVARLLRLGNSFFDVIPAQAGMTDYFEFHLSFGDSFLGQPAPGLDHRVRIQ